MSVCLHTCIHASMSSFTYKLFASKACKPTLAHDAPEGHGPVCVHMESVYLRIPLGGPGVLTCLRTLTRCAQVLAIRRGVGITVSIGLKVVERRSVGGKCGLSPICALHVISRKKSVRSSFIELKRNCSVMSDLFSER